MKSLSSQVLSFNGIVQLYSFGAVLPHSGGDGEVQMQTLLQVAVCSQMS